MIASLAGIPVGVGAGFGIRHWLAGHASIRFIGQDETIVALLDTGNERIMMFLGQPAEHVLQNVQQLLPVGRRRIDLVIASHHWLTTDGFRDQLDLHEINAVSLQESRSVSPIRGKIHPIIANQSIDVGDHTRIDIALMKRLDGGSHRDGTNPDFRLEVTCDGATLVLASGHAALQRASGNPHLLAVPGDIDLSGFGGTSPQIFVGTSLQPDRDGAQFQTFFNDPIEFTIQAGSVHIRKDQLLS